MKQITNQKKQKKQHKQSIKELLSKNPGFKGFLIKTVIFIVLFIAIQILTIPLQKINLPDEYALSYLLHPELGNVIIFSVIAFFLLARNKLLKIKYYKQNWKETSLLGFLFVVGLSAYFYLKYYLSTHTLLAVKYVSIFLPLQYLILALFAVLLFLAVFGIKTTKNLFKEFKKELLTVLLVAIITYVSVELLKNAWKYLSFAVSHAVFFLLNLNGISNLVLQEGPKLGAGSFIVGIGKPCSGVDSLTLFILLFLFILFIDWKVINKKRMAILFIPGAIGMFLVNILRIYLLMLVGIFYSKDFAIGMFHSNAGWIFFIIYASLFWWKAYGWVKRK